jgi:hypothetical protein
MSLASVTEERAQFPLPTGEAAPKASSGDDVIEDYMLQLLQRVRGESSVSPTTLRTLFPQEERSPRAEAELSIAEPNAPAGPALLTETEYQPRSQAPEMGMDLATMRAIANENRNKHIRKHARRTWMDRTKVQFTGTVAGFSVAFASFFYLDTHPEPAALGMFAGLAIAGFWTWQAVHGRKLLLESLSLNEEEVAPGGSAMDEGGENPA